MDITVILFFLAGLFLLFVLGKFLLIPVRIITSLLLNGIMGGIILFLFNLFGSIFNLSLDITPLNAIIVGFLGVPGVIILLLVKLLF